MNGPEHYAAGEAAIAAGDYVKATAHFAAVQAAAMAQRAAYGNQDVYDDWNAAGVVTDYQARERARREET